MTTVERILDYNQGRDPDRLALKYKLISSSPAAFFRGTAHLFYEDLPVCPLAPNVWVSGDAHLENFGVYKGDNRLVYFDFNDFDEAALAPITIELIRMLTGILVSGIKTNPADFLNDYARELATGKPRWVERETSIDGVRDLVYSLKGRSKKQLLASRTVMRKNRRVIGTDGSYALPLQEGEFVLLDNLLSSLEEPFKLRSAARRIAGNGSLGVSRYILLVEGDYLLDLKQARPSLLASHFQQPYWPSDAHRVVGIQRRMQAISPAFLLPVQLNSDFYVLRELVPREDRIRLELFKQEKDFMRNLLLTEASLMAWSHLRSSGRQGSAIADDLIDFGQSPSWKQDVLRIATQQAKLVIKQYQEFESKMPSISKAKASGASSSQK